MTIKTITAIRKTKKAQRRDFEKINKIFKNNDVVYQISLYVLYKVHLPLGVYKILSAFDAFRQKLCSI